MKAPQTNSTPRTLVPQGTHIAICYQMIELGTQKESYKGEEKEKYKVMLSWELPYEKMDDGKPMVISREYTFFMGDKANLRKDIEAWRGAKFTEEGAKDFDIEVLLGKPCQLTIVHKTALSSGNVRDEVVSVSGIAKGMQIPAQTNSNKVLSFENWNESAFDSLPKYIQEKITSSPEYKNMKHSEEVAEFPPKDGPGEDFFAPQTDIEKEVKSESETPLF